MHYMQLRKEENDRLGGGLGSFKGIFFTGFACKPIQFNVFWERGLGWKRGLNMSRVGLKRLGSKHENDSIGNAL